MTDPEHQEVRVPGHARTRNTLVALLVLAGAAAAGCGSGATTDGLEVEATIDGTPIEEATPRAPLDLDPDTESILELAITNPGDEAVDLERVRLEGELLGLTFLTYDVRVRTTVGAGSSTTLEVPLDFFDLERQATGYLRSSVRTYDADEVRVSSDSLVVDVAGSPFSTMSLFAYSLLVLTVAGFAKNFWDASKGRLPANRFHRGLRFVVPGLGLGLLLSVAFSVLRIFPLPATGWVPLTLIPALVAFGIGYFFVPGAADEESLSDEDDLDDDDLLEDLAAGAATT